MDEEWRPVVGYEWIYQVSNLGNVRSIDRIDSRKHKRVGVVLKRMIDSHGYYEVNLCKNGRVKPTQVHKLVMRAFVGERPDGCDINHKDGNKTNPSVDNLEYVTEGYNVQHAFDHGLNHGRKGQKHHYAKFTNEQAKEVREIYARGGISHKELGKIFGVSASSISDIVRFISYRE